MRTGIANLPLHYGKVPSWLFDRMKILAREITIFIVEEFGKEEFLRKIADPFWFQAFGCVLGFDWHSSGVTTTVCGALKEGLKGIEKDVGIFIAGGKGKVSRKTPEEIQAYAEKIPLNPDKLIYASYMSAKVDSAALQDGFQLYHHCFIFITNGNWAVIQQGMNDKTRLARRYHWLQESVKDFVCEPHAAICSEKKVRPLNLVAAESEKARHVITELARDKPEKLISELKKIEILNLPYKHTLGISNLHPESIKKVLLKTYTREPEDFRALLSIKGVGPKTLRALSLISELVYGTPPSYRDPAKFSFAHGGKDGYPYPIDRETYDKTIEILNRALSKAAVDRQEKINAIKRLTKIVI